MDFRGGMTQAQIGQRLRISQMHVSRLRAHALAHLRSHLLDPEQHASQGRPGRRTPRSQNTADADHLCADRKSPDMLPCRHQRQAWPGERSGPPRTTTGVRGRAARRPRTTPGQSSRGRRPAMTTARASGAAFVVEAGETPPPGQDPALPLKQEGESMPGADLSTRDCSGHVVVVLSGALDTTAAAAVTAPEPQVIAELPGPGSSTKRRGYWHAGTSRRGMPGPASGPGSAPTSRPGTPARSTSRPGEGTGHGESTRSHRRHDHKPGYPGTT
jgi:hypothetical protein